MAKIQTLAELQSLRDKLVAQRAEGEKTPGSVVIKVAYATCGIAAGAKEVLEHMEQKAKELGINATFVKTGCMGYCYAEPTLEVLIPGRESVVFGYVDEMRADDILTKYVINNEFVEGIIPVNYETID